MIKKLRVKLQFLKSADVLSLWILTYVIRMSLPNVNILFIGCSAFLFLYVILIADFNITTLYKRSKVLIVFIFYLFFNGYYFAQKFFEIPRLRSETLQIPVLLLFVFSLIVLIKTKRQLDEFSERLLMYFYYSALIVAILGIVKFIFLGFGIELLGDDKNYIAGSSLTSDYNFYALSLISGLIAYFFLKVSDRTNVKLKLEQLFLITVPIAIFSSGSRRGFLVIITMYIVMLVFFIYGKVYSRRKTQDLISFAKPILKSFVIIIAILYFSFFAAAQFNIKIPEGEKILNHEYRLMTSNMLYRYTLIFDNSSKYDKVYGMMWYNPVVDVSGGQAGVQTGVAPPKDFNKVLSPRTQRWAYAKTYFDSEMTTGQQWFGGGFSYMESFGERFKVATYDYPHNVFLSAWIATGWVGVLLILSQILLGMWNFFQRRKNDGALLLLFLITLLYVSTSGNTFLSVPFFVVLLIIGLFSGAFINDCDEKSA